MCVYFKIFGLQFPAYGSMIAIGLVIASTLGVLVIGKKHGINPYDFLIMEAYCLLFGILGAKILYFIVSFKYIDWHRFFHDGEYFTLLMNGGFVFYGGLIFGAVGALVGSKIHKISLKEFALHGLFMVPMIHAFGRVGCFLAGCCYGIPYDGHIAVIFPENEIGGGAPAGIPLFPVQLVESVCLLVISLIMIAIDRKGKNAPTVSFYLIAYAIVRFTLENYRYDSIRGSFKGFSTSQWISMGLIIFGILMLFVQYGFRKKQEAPVIPGENQNDKVEENK